MGKDNGALMHDWRIRETLTLLFLQGKTLAELEFPEKWTHDPLRCIWEKDEGWNSEHNGEITQQKLCLSDYYLACGSVQP